MSRGMGHRGRTLSEVEELADGGGLVMELQRACTVVTDVSVRYSGDRGVRASDKQMVVLLRAGL